MIMAKGNMLLGKARGRVGNLVFYDNKGQQVVRAYQPRMSNPQTQAQQVNRVIMNTVTQAWKFLKPFCYYEGHAKSEFRSLFFKWNIAHLKNKLANSENPLNEVDFTPLSRNKFTCNSWDFVRGPLQTPSIVYTDTSAFKIDIEGIENFTYENIAELFGLQRGGSFNFISWYLPGDDISLATEIIPKYTKLILDPYDDGLQTSFDVEMFDENLELQYLNPQNVGINTIYTCYDGEPGIGFNQIDDSAVWCTQIWTQDKDGSCSNLVTTFNTVSLDNYFERAPAGIFTKLIEAISKIEPQLPSEIYLNNASE